MLSFYRIMVLWFTQLCVCQGLPELSHYAAEDKAVDELIVNAANSTTEFEFFYDEKENLLKIEYDIVYSVEEWKDLNRKEKGRKKRTAAVIHGKQGAKRWPDAKIYYQFTLGDFTEKERGIIESAMDEWSAHTCLTFKEDPEVQNAIVIKNAGGCFSRVGMVGGFQTLALGKACRFKGVVLHELGHTIGLHHEQTRPDRDQHVTIKTENIPEPMKFNFRKYEWDTIQEIGIPYDYSSIMHYGKNAFSMNGEPTIVTVDPKMQDTIGQKHGLSFRDIKTVNIMYNCKRAQPGCAKDDADCPGEGFVGSDCLCYCPGLPVQLCSLGGGDNDGGGEAISKKKEEKKLIVTEKECEDQHQSCPHWSSIGECKRNPSYMLVYCKMSCKTCGMNGKSTMKKKAKSVISKNSCRDFHGTCTSWASRGFCNSPYYIQYMSTNCKKSCGKCTESSSTAANYYHPGVGTTSCRDLNFQCKSWASTGECRKNPRYMNTQCQRSCGLCRDATSNVAYGPGYTMSGYSNCRDSSGSCHYWASTGECVKNPAYMNVSCRKSCGRC